MPFITCKSVLPESYSVRRFNHIHRRIVEWFEKSKFENFKTNMQSRRTSIRAILFKVT